MSATLDVLLFEDNLGDARLTIELLRETVDAAISLTHVVTFADGASLLSEREFAAALVDLSLPDASGLDTVRGLRAIDPRIPLVVLSGHADEAVAIEALHAGAQDYLVKGDADGRAIARSIRYAIERKRDEFELIEAKNLAEAADQVKSRFLAHMSHELRTPLNAIIGFSELVASSGDATSREYAGFINSSGRQLLELVNQVLDLSKAVAGKLVLREDRVDLARLLQACVDHATPTAVRRKIAIRLIVTSNFPALVADEPRLKQAVQNLLSNAVKFSESETVVTVSLARGGGGDVAIAIADQGIGMLPEDIPMALEPFRQLESGFSEHEGAGLGLPMAKLIVESHGGTLGLESVPGTGTTALLTLPQARYLTKPAAEVLGAASVAA